MLLETYSVNGYCFIFSAGSISWSIFPLGWLSVHLSRDISAAKFGTGWVHAAGAVQNFWTRDRTAQGEQYSAVRAEADMLRARATPDKDERGEEKSCRRAGDHN